MGRHRAERGVALSGWREFLGANQQRRDAAVFVGMVLPAQTGDAPRALDGDGYYESYDAGVTWHSPSSGLDVGYLRSVAIDCEQSEVVVVSAASGPYSAYLAGRSDGRLYRRVASEPWERVRDGWPEPASTIAPLLSAGTKAAELWATDERGVHRSDDSGKSWRRVAAYLGSPHHLRGLALVR